MNPITKLGTAAEMVEIILKDAGLTLNKDVKGIAFRNPQEAIQGLRTGRGGRSTANRAPPGRRSRPRVRRRPRARGGSCGPARSG